MSSTMRDVPLITGATHPPIIRAIGGSATSILALCGLSGVNGPLMMVLATIVFGGAQLLEGRQIQPRHDRPVWIHEHIHRLCRATLYVAGLYAVVIGLLALLDIGSPVLIPVASVVFGVALVISAPAVSSFQDAVRESAYLQELSATQTFVGVGVIVLAALAAAGVRYDVTLNLVALLCLGIYVSMLGVNLSLLLISWTRRAP